MLKHLHISEYQFDKEVRIAAEELNQARDKALLESQANKNRLEKQIEFVRKEIVKAHNIGIDTNLVYTYVSCFGNAMPGNSLQQEYTRLVLELKNYTV